MNKEIINKTWTNIYYSRGFKHRIVASGSLTQLDGNPSPYFSITGEMHYQAKNNKWVDQKAGAIHEDILKHFPQLKPLVDIHLSDDEGRPMHAAANAVYWSGFTKYQPEDIPKLARHLRVNESAAAIMVKHLKEFYAPHDVAEAWEKTFIDFSLPKMWRNDASVAYRLLQSDEQEEA